MKIKKLTVSILLLIVFTGFLFNGDIYSYLVENFLFIQSFYENDPEMFIINFVFAYLFMTTLSLENFVVEGSLAALLGIGYVTYRKFHIPHVYKELDHTCHVKHSEFAQFVVELKVINVDNLWEKFVYDLDYLLLDLLQL